MKNRDLAILCLRILGIYFIVHGLSAYPNIAIYIIEHGKKGIPLYIYATPNIYLICGLVLSFAAPRISKKIIPNCVSEDGTLNISISENIARIAFLILGIYILTNSLPQLIRESIAVGIYYTNLQEIAEGFRETRPKWTYLIGPIIQTTIALILILGPNRIVRLLAKYDNTFKKIESSNKALE